ncbi:MAG: cell division protein ZapE [Rhodospirillaceae bacterium]|nr:cell division protein ZapE [Rhodospirillales bacterium]
MSEGPLYTYRERLKSGEIRPDPAQELAVEKLQSLTKAVRGYRPMLGESGWLARFGIGAKPAPAGLKWTPGDAIGAVPKQGLYIFGEVGRGKSMLMDLFYENTAVAGKRRVHFHEFMRDIHGAIHAWRQAGAKGDDPIPTLVRDLAANAWLLCLDELQITDIADAMIVGRLFQGLMDAGVVVVITSNRPPKDLYKDGLQRDRFLPFIGLMESRLDLLQLDSERDYRLGRKRGLQVYHAPLGGEAEAQLNAAFARLTEGAVPRPDVLTVHGRKLTVPVAAVGVARFQFQELCGTALGASDYIELATLYHTLVLSGIPQLSPENKDEARRFVTLVDALYEHKVTLICSAAAPPETLYPTGIGAFEFQRTVSRLMEMQAEDYVTRQHLT